MDGCDVGGDLVGYLRAAEPAARDVFDADAPILRDCLGREDFSVVGARCPNIWEMKSSSAGGPRANLKHDLQSSYLFSPNIPSIMRRITSRSLRVCAGDVYCPRNHEMAISCDLCTSQDSSQDFVMLPWYPAARQTDQWNGDTTCDS